jgi:hypothetical protein
MTRLAVLLLFAFASKAGAVELHIQFGALERLLAEQVFTEDGRRYVQRSATARCSFAYLEKPKVKGADGKLRIRAQFT